MKKLMLAFVLMSFVVFSSSSVAQIVEKSSDLSAYGGILKVDSGDSELMFGARYSYNMTVNNAIEGTFGIMLPEHAKVFLYHVNFRYNIALQNEMLVPFVTGGVGAVTYSFDDDVAASAAALDGTSMSINFGGGMQYFTSENMAVRIDVRDHIIMYGEKTVDDHTFDVGNTNNIEISGGITFFFI
jgi:outer membrane beta-barrel protein